MSKFAEIFKSATKIVLLMLSLAMIVGLFTGHIAGEQFMMIASMVFAFYFKGSTTNVDTDLK